MRVNDAGILKIPPVHGFRILSGSLYGGAAMAQPDYLVCVDCETPCYVFEWKDGKVTDILCPACGNDDPQQFLSPEDLDALDSH